VNLGGADPPFGQRRPEAVQGSAVSTRWVAPLRMRSVSARRPDNDMVRVLHFDDLDDLSADSAMRHGSDLQGGAGSRPSSASRSPRRRRATFSTRANGARTTT
jgi:hypothetical protein